MRARSWTSTLAWMGRLGILVALCLAVAGCGGEETPKERYERAFVETVKEWEERGEREAPDVPDDASLPQQSEAAAVGVEMMRGMARDLRRLEPPDEIRRAHEDYVRSLEGLSEDLKKVVAAMRRDDQAAAERLVQPGPGHFADPENVRLVAGARREFERKGYDLGLPEFGVGG